MRCLFLNGLWLLGKISDNEIWVINIFSRRDHAVRFALYLAFGPGADAGTIKAAALTLLFTFTYFWVAINRHNGADGRGLGWFSLFVAITAVPVAVDTLASASSFWGVWFGLCWAAWAFLWFLYFLLLALKKPILKFTGTVTAAEGVLTGWLPGYLLLQGIIA